MRIRDIYRFLKTYLISRNKKFILIDTPEHGNIGDHAITIAEQQFLDKYFGENSYYELTARNINKKEHIYSKLIAKDKIILVNGGGFLGSLWPEEEYRFRRILEAFSDYRIIVFPQTITFDLQTDEGRNFFMESKRIYMKHKNLTIFVRDYKSYLFVKEHMIGLNVFYVPDIVANYSVAINENIIRKNIILCFRKDIERIIDDKGKNDIIKILNKKYSNEKLIYTDTVINRSIGVSERKNIVEEKLKEFSKCKLVVTDRLHGMILAAITNTPCIAFNNVNGKVKEVYKWINNNKYIQFVNDEREFLEALNKIDIDDTYIYNKSEDIKNKFSLLYEYIK